MSAWRETGKLPTTKLNEPIPLDEKQRTYHYPEGHSVTVERPVELILRESGDHRLKCEDGLLYVIRCGWYYLEIDKDKNRDWTV